MRHLGERLRSRFLRRLWCEPRRRAVVQAPRILSELCWPAHVRFRGPLCRQRRAACPDPTMGALRSPRLAIPHGVRSQDDQPRAPHLRSSGLVVDATPRAHAPNQGSPRDRRRDRDTTFWLSRKFEFAFPHADDRWGLSTHSIWLVPCSIRFRLPTSGMSHRSPRQSGERSRRSATARPTDY